MELLAVIVALEALKSNEYPVDVFSDSKYVVEAVTKGWVFTWSKNGFKKKKNPDLWQRYLKLHPQFQITYHWVKGHAGHPENERCDRLAVRAAESSDQLIDTYFEANRETND